jgi:preprotein translocase subunit SecG
MPNRQIRLEADPLWSRDAISGGLAALGGGSTDMVMGGRQAVTILHTISWWTGGLFMVLSLILSLLASRANLGATDVQQQLRTTPAPVAPAPLQQAPPIGEAVPPPAPDAPVNR